MITELINLCKNVDKTFEFLFEIKADKLDKYISSFAKSFRRRIQGSHKNRRKSKGLRSEKA